MRRSNAGNIPSGGFLDPFEGFGFGNNTSQHFFANSPFANDPFFTDPFPSIFGRQNMLGSGSLLGGSPFLQPFRQFQQQLEGPRQVSRSRPTVVEVGDEHAEAGRENQRSRRTSEPIVEHPDDEGDEREAQREHHTEREERDRDQEQQSNRRQMGPAGFGSFGLVPRGMGGGGGSFSFQSSSVTISGMGGVQTYSSSGYRRQGPDGLMEEQWQEEDSSGRKNMSVKRALGDQARQLSRSRASDGRDRRLEQLYNLQPEEAVDFDQTWQARARESFPHHRNDNLTRSQVGRTRAALPAPSGDGPQRRRRLDNNS